MAVVEVVTAEQSQQELIAEARIALSSSAWKVGELASKYCAGGGTLQEFADGLECSKSSIVQQKSVWDRFGAFTGGKQSPADPHIRNEFPNLSWSHYRLAVTWDDAGVWLRKAARFEWTRERMVDERERSMPASVDQKPDVTPSKHVDAPDSSGNTHIGTVDGVPATAETSHVDVDPQPAPPTTSKRTAERKPHLEPESAKPVLPWGLKAAMESLRNFCSELMTFRGPDRKAMATELRSKADELDPPAEKPNGRFKPPTVEEVRAFVTESRYADHVDPEDFVLFYESKGWKVGDQPMKNWRAAVGTWRKKAIKEAAGKKPDGRVEAKPGKYQLKEVEL